MEKKIEQIAELESSEITRLYREHFAGFIGIVFQKAGVPRKNPIPKSYFDSLKYGLCTSMYGGCEPEFETEEQFLNWETMHENFQYMTEDQARAKLENGWSQKCPYQDKSIPYIVNIKLN